MSETGRGEEEGEREKREGEERLRLVFSSQKSLVE
jgi:hypothetical protein